jgi:hypothetical protein
MRFTSIVSAALLLFMSSPAIGQEYVEFKSQQDRFGLTFPVQPKVTEITYTSQFGAPLRARVYSAESGQSRFIATVVDYSNLEALLTEKSKSCPPGAETCRGGGSSTGAGYWRADMAGAVIYATAQLMKRNAKVEYFGWNNINLVEGHQLTLINSDKSKTSAAIYMHENRLYILEGTVPPGYPVADFFPQSVEWLDEKGDSIRYETLYHHGLPKPAIGRGGGGGGQGQGGRGGRGGNQGGAPQPQ